MRLSDHRNQQAFFSLLSLLLIVWNCTAYAQEEDVLPDPVPVGAYQEYFQYYSPIGLGMPAGAELASKAVVLLSVKDIPNSTSDRGTGFLINTYRKDKKICLCTAGHVVSSLDLGTHSVEVYLKYIGKAMPSHLDPQQILGTFISSYASTMHLELVARQSVTSDWALLLVDPDELPVRDYATLAYIFDSEFYSQAPAGSYFTLGHPLSLTQRVADSLQYSTDRLSQFPPTSTVFALDPVATRSNPGGLAKVASGSPLVNNSLLSPAVTGIMVRVHSAAAKGLIPLDRIPPEDRRSFYFDPDYFTFNSRGFIATKLSTPALMAAIKRHCWDKDDSLAIETDGGYKKGVRIDNTEPVNEFEQNRIIANQAGLEAAADQSYNASNIGAMLVKAAKVIVNCTIANKSGRDRLYCLAKEILLEAGFSYMASGAKELDMNIVVTESEPMHTSSALMSVRNSISRHRTLESDRAADTFSVCPNPSTDGVFYISLPSGAGQYRLTVYSSDGRCVLEASNISGSRYQLVLRGGAKGVYMLNIYRQRTGDSLMRKVIIY